MTTIRFSKMQALGNDFVVVDGIAQTVALDPVRLRQLCHRHYGIGCDQWLAVEPATDGRSDFFYRIYNADGSESGQCGNGARCLALFIRRQALSDRDDLRLQTRDGRLHVRFLDGGLLEVDMGIPELAPAAVPFIAHEGGGEGAEYMLDLAESTVTVGVLAIGNPHAVMVVDDVARADVARIGPEIESHPAFPERVNVGFLEVVDRQHIRLRVFERGAGETLACGSGACAAVVSGRLRGLLDARVTVELPGGSLLISWPGKGQAVQMTGTANHVFDGEINL